MRFRRHQEAAQATTWGLLLGFALALVVVVLTVNGLLALAYHLTLPLARHYPAYFFETNTLLVLLFVGGGCWLEGLRLREGGTHVARLAGARPIETGDAPLPRLETRFANIVQEMALASRRRPPQPWVLARDDRINAFAAGWDEGDAVIAVTRGALERLTREELQGVVAHEMGHLVHGDTRLNMRLIGLVWGLQLLHGLGRTLSQRDDRGHWRPGVLFGLALRFVGSLGWLAGRVLQASVSRQREFLADASAVQFTRQVQGLGGALRKIAGEAASTAGPDAPEAIAHLWLGPRRGADAAGSWRRWLATHPPIRERLRRLYGHEVEPLATPILPELPPEAPWAAAMVHATGALAPMASGGVRADAPSERAAARRQRPEALRHDATQRPESHDQAEREREALQRIDFWHSPTERLAGLLALMLPADIAVADPAWQRWQHCCAAFSAVADAEPLLLAVRTEIGALGPATRVRVFEQLAARSRAAPPSERRRMLRQARALGGGALAVLQRAALRRALRDRPTPSGLRAGLPLEALGSAAWGATKVLAAALNRGRDFARCARALLPPPTAAGGAQRQPPQALRRLSWSQRPRLVRAWAEAAQRAGVLDEADTMMALTMASRLLDTPLPLDLQAKIG